MELQAFSPELVPLGIVEGYTSLRWQRNYNAPGSFELHCPLLHAGLLIRGNILWIKGDHEAGIIESRVVARSAENGETIVIAGRMLTSLLHRRVISGSIQTSNVNYEDLIRTLVNQAAITCVPERVIPRLYMPPPVGHAQKLVEEYQSSYGVVGVEVSQMSTASGLGYRIALEPQTQRMRFEVYAGVDRSTAQTERSPCIFSTSYENLLSCQYSESDLQHQNVAYVAGEESTTADRALVVVGNASGLERREMYVDAKGLKHVVTVLGVKKTLTEPQYLATLNECGAGKLAGKELVQSFDAKVCATGTLRYRVDFDLGDIVTVQELGMRIHTRITQCEEVYEVSGCSVFVTFGDPPKIQRA